MAYSLITGASGGLGWALATELASKKHDVLLVARSEDNLRKNTEELKQKYGVKADYLAIDLAVPNAALTVLGWLNEKNYPIDILINNAGYAVWGKLQELEREELDQMMQLNMVTLADLCKLLIPQLLKNSRAYILNVSSTSAYQAVPTLANYAATKAFVLVFTRALRWELKDTNISVSCLSPGTISTGFMDRAKMEPLKDKAEKFSMKAEPVAKSAISGMFAGKAEIIPGVMNVVSAKMAEILPKVLIEKIAYNIYKVKKD